MSLIDELMSPVGSIAFLRAEKLRPRDSEVLNGSSHPFVVIILRAGPGRHVEDEEFGEVVEFEGPATLGLIPRDVAISLVDAAKAIPSDHPEIRRSEVDPYADLATLLDVLSKNEAALVVERWSYPATRLKEYEE